MPRLGLRLTPHGHLLLDAAEDAPILDNTVAQRLAETFGRSTGHGLVQLGPGAASEATSSPTLPRVPPPSQAEIATLVLTAPIMPGAEYLDADVLLTLW